MRAQGLAFQQVLEHYSSDTMTNDIAVVQFVQETFDQSIPLLSTDLVYSQICRALESV